MKTCTELEAVLHLSGAPGFWQAASPLNAPPVSALQVPYTSLSASTDVPPRAVGWPRNPDVRGVCTWWLPTAGTLSFISVPAQAAWLSWPC